MKVSQIASILNTVTNEVLGAEDIVQEDLSNIVDIGKQIFDASANSMDNYVKSLINHIGKVVFVNRPYAGSAPSVLMDGWEYGSILEKIRVELPEAVENDSWKLTDNQSYDPNVFYQPTVRAKFFNSKTTFEVRMSFTVMQVKESFDSPSQMNAFVSMIENEIQKSISIKTDALIMRTINNFTALTFHDLDATGKYGNFTGSRCVNLLKLYNDKFSKTLTPNASIYDKDFIRFASYMIALYTKRISKASRIFNIGGNVRFTPKDKLHLVMLEEFKAAADVYLQSDTFHDQYSALPNAEGVPYWQGSGDDYAFSSTSEINVKTQNPGGETPYTIHATGILAVMFDRDALAVCNVNKRVTSNYNPRAEFTTNWYKNDAMYMNDTDENFVVFYVAAAED